MYIDLDRVNRWLAFCAKQPQLKVCFLRLPGALDFVAGDEVPPPEVLPTLVGCLEHSCCEFWLGRHCAGRILIEAIDEVENLSDEERAELAEKWRVMRERLRWLRWAEAVPKKRD